MSIDLFLFDDAMAREWLPFTLTRPAGEMLFGTETLRARAERVLGLRCRGHISDAGLSDFEELGAPPCASAEAIGPDNDRLLLASRLVPAEDCPLLSRLRQRARLGTAGGSGDGNADALAAPLVLVVGSEPAGAWLPRGTRLPRCTETGRYPSDWASTDVSGQLLGSPWELMAKNAAQISRDSKRFRRSEVPAGVHVLGDGTVAIGTGAQLEPGTVLDATGGPVILADGVQVRARSRIAGPFYAGPDTALLGGSLASSSIGPRCKVRGEVERSVLLGYANKAHDGFLGHSVVGRWVNLGAMTTSSDLKNNYGPVRVLLRGRRIETKMRKVGCFLGDHVRTGIGTLLDTGTIVEAGSNLFGGGVQPKYVPPFSWGAGSAAAEYELGAFLDTAKRVMGRRNVTLSEGARRLYERAFARTAALRPLPQLRQCGNAPRPRDSGQAPGDSERVPGTD